jgi:hypothetical protein
LTLSFQTQETPPRLKHSDRDRHQDLIDEDTAQHPTSGDVAHPGSETNTSKSAVSTPIPSSSPKAKARPKKLGAIGGKGALITEDAISPPRTAKDPSYYDFSTQSDDDDEMATGSKKPELGDKRLSDRRPRRTGGTLGKIGGGRKVAEKRVSPRPGDSSGEEAGARQQSHQRQNKDLDNNPNNPPSQFPPKPKRTGKLGTIGGKPHQMHSPNGKDTERVHLESRPRMSTPTDSGTGDHDLGAARRKPNPKSSATQSSSPAPADTSRPSASSPKEAVKGGDKEETAEEKANRKREDLKRQLQSKAAAPAKRKRKF